MRTGRTKPPSRKVARLDKSRTRLRQALAAAGSRIEYLESRIAALVPGAPEPEAQP